MSNIKSIFTELQDLQEQNERLKAYDKLFDKFCILEFGMPRNAVKKQLNIAKKIPEKINDTSIKVSE